MKKRVLITILLILLAGAGGVGGWYYLYRRGGESPANDYVAFVDSVAMIAGLQGNGIQNRFSGVVEPQRTVGVEVAYGLKVKETYVTVGQEVKEGTKLFSYDTDEAQDNITQLEIDIENYDIEIEATKAQIEQYEKERAKVSDSEKRAYTTSIMTAENSIRRAEYNKKSKQAEMESLKKQVANADVFSELQGVVQKINKSNSGNSEDYSDMGYSDGSDENANAYITIMATGEYRIKGKVNEQNAQQLYEGMDMIVHSRVDESLTWHGMISLIDREHVEQNNNNYYYSGDSSTTSSSYPFYIELEDSTGLMLGQHVYAEPDNGQDEERSGIWLDEYYLITNEEGEYMPYVWAANGDFLERRRLTLGDYDDELMQYEILEGLTADDYIAMPTDDLTEGMRVTRNTDQVSAMDDMGGYDEGYIEDGGYDEGYIEEGGYDEGYIEDGYIEDGGYDEGFIEEDGYEVYDEDMGDEGFVEEAIGGAVG